MRSRLPHPVALLLAALHAYIGLRLLAPFEPVVQAGGAAVLAASLWFVPKGWHVREGRGPWAILLPWLTMGFFSWLLVLTLARDVALVVSVLALPPDTYAAWVRASAAAVMALVPAITLVGYFMARRVAAVRELAHHTAPLGGLESRHGTYVVTGNHEYYSGAHAWIHELRRLGTRVLLNEHVVIEHDGARLAVAGVTDYSAHHFDPSHRSDAHAAAAGAPADIVKVLLAHQPRSAHLAQHAGFDLQLSGHTHGGQFWPWNHFVRLQQPFTAGLHRLGDMWIYISRGTGYWGPPMRFGIPSEITRIRLARG